MKTKKNNSGFSLIELIVTLAIFALIMLVGAPALFQQIQRERIHAAANSMYNYIQTAQELSVSSGRIIGIAPEAGINWENQPLVMAYISETQAENAANAAGNANSIRAADATIIAKETILNATVGQYSVTTTRNAVNTNGATGLFGHPSLNYIYFFPDGIVTAPIFTLNTNDNATVAIISNCLEPNGNENWYKVGITHFGPNNKADLSGTDPTRNAKCRETN